MGYTTISYREVLAVFVTVISNFNQSVFIQQEHPYKRTPPQLKAAT
jgi:hypothetical protein